MIISGNGDSRGTDLRVTTPALRLLKSIFYLTTMLTNRHNLKQEIKQDVKKEVLSGISSNPDTASLNKDVSEKIHLKYEKELEQMKKEIREV
jgi:hypothetical protein